MAAIKTISWDNHGTQFPVKYTFLKGIPWFSLGDILAIFGDEKSIMSVKKDIRQEYIQRVMFNDSFLGDPEFIFVNYWGLASVFERYYKQYGAVDVRNWITYTAIPEIVGNKVSGENVTIDDFLKNYCVVDGKSRIQSSALFEIFVNVSNSEISNRAFSLEMKKKGFEMKRLTSGKYFLGLALKE